MLMEKERQLVAEYGRKLLQYGLTMNTGGNLSMRDRQTGYIVIKPSGRPYETLKPEDIPVMDENGKVLEGKYRPSSEWRMHAAIYKAYPRAEAIVHCHSTCATAMGVAEQTIPLINHELCVCCSSPVRVAPFAMPGSQELADSAVEALGADNRAAILQNHGTVAYGCTMLQAFESVCAVEEAAKAYFIARLMGSVHEIPEAGRKALRGYDPLTGPDSPIGEIRSV